MRIVQRQSPGGMSRLTALANVRHAEAVHDSLLAAGVDRWTARAEVQGAVIRVVEWREEPD